MYNAENILVFRNILRHKAGQDDGLKIGLVIQGGGMRGAFGAGVALELTSLGLNESFDVIHTSSSGCNTAAYMVTSQTQVGSTIYRDKLSRFRFIRPWSLKKAMNLDYLIDVLTAKEKPLDLDRLRKSKTLLKMYVTDFVSGHSEYFTNHQNVDFLSAMKASCAYPNHFPPVLVDGKLYLDGNIATILPIEQAIRDRCTDILVVTTVPENHHEKPKTRFHNKFINVMSRKFTIDFKDVRKHRIELYNNSLDLAFGRVVPENDVRIYTVSPDYMISSASILAKSLRNYVDHGQQKMHKIMDSVLTN